MGDTYILGPWAGVAAWGIKKVGKCIVIFCGVMWLTLEVLFMYTTCEY
jgi:uncharacterized membrane protein (Fun14 family)